MRTIKMVFKFDINDSKEHQELLEEMMSSKDELIEDLSEDFENVSIEIIEE